MTIDELNVKLKEFTERLLRTQAELETAINGLAVAKDTEERAYNSELLRIVGEAKASGTKEPTEAVKAAMCEAKTEKERLDRRVLELTREGLRSRIEVLTTTISVFQTHAKLLTEELQLSRYGRSNQT